MSRPALCDWGYVRELEALDRLPLAWLLAPQGRFGPRREKATELEVTFTAEGDDTRVR